MDKQGIIYPNAQANTPSILSSATALSDNSGNGSNQRGAWMIQNLGTNPLYVLMGTGASTTVFHVILKAAVSQDDGTGGSYSQFEGVIYSGIVTVAGTSPRYVVTEIL